jgi:hypothetical protein
MGPTTGTCTCGNRVARTTTSEWRWHHTPRGDQACTQNPDT